MFGKTAIAGAVLTIALGGALQGAERIVPPAVPGDIQVLDGFKPFFKGHAIGTQNYMCELTSDGYKWVLLGPQATLFDEAGEQVITHFLSKNPSKADALQATWLNSRDTSGLWAKKLVGSSDAAFVAPDAIEWLLLEVTGAFVGPTGGDKLSGAKYVQRVNTYGGIEPAVPCGADLLNNRRFVDYQADYFFFK